MAIRYAKECFLEIRNIEDIAIRNFIMEILKNGSFLKHKEHSKNGRFKTILKVGYTIYFEQYENDILVLSRPFRISCQHAIVPKILS